MITCSIGICVYNEEKNILHLLESLSKQNLRTIKIGEIIVVASGTTDSTCTLVNRYKKHDKRIRLIKQTQREGKPSAVNLFISEASYEILVLMGGDLLLSKTVIERLVKKFHDENVGMTGAHPVPLNKPIEGFASLVGIFLWDLHHMVSLRRPKMGELIAFRKIFKRISVTSGADEANIEPLIINQGYKLVYVPDAVVYNKAPTTISDYIKQRRRNYWLHLALKEEQRYAVSTMDSNLLLHMLFSYMKDNFSGNLLLILPTIVLLELLSRSLAIWDYKILKQRYTIWETIETTKSLKA